MFSIWFAKYFWIYVGDSLARQNGQRFTTFDADNDLKAYNCAERFHGAWWYKSCHHSNLNGEYGNDNYGSGPNWYHWRGHYYALNSTRMMIRVRRYWLTRLGEAVLFSSIVKLHITFCKSVYFRNTFWCIIIWQCFNCV